MQKVRQGEPFRPPAATWNAFIDAARAHQAQRKRPGNGQPKQSQKPPTVSILNDSGVNVDAFGVLGIDSPLITPATNLEDFQLRPALKGVEPTSADHTGKFVVLAEPISDGAMGRAYAFGVFPALVTINDEADERADVTDGDSAALSSNHDGAAFILWKPGASSAGGPRWCVVRMDGGPEQCSVEAPETIGDSVYGSETADTTTAGRDPDGSETHNGVPISMWVVFETGYDAVVTFKGWQKKREIRQDACGKWYYTGVEVLSYTFETEECVP